MSRRFLAVLLCLCMVATLLPVAVFAAVNYNLNNTTKTLYLNKDNATGLESSHTFEVLGLNPISYKCSWYVNDDSIVDLSSNTRNATVTAKKTGTVTLACEIYGRNSVEIEGRLYATIVVKANATSVSITNAPNNYTMKVGDSFTFERTMEAENGGEATDKTEWFVSDETVGSITKDDGKGVFTANSVGIVSIYAKTYQSSAALSAHGYTAESAPVTITVKNRDGSAPSADMGSITVFGNTDTAITPLSTTISLTNEKFIALAAETNVSGWFTNLPVGLAAKITSSVLLNGTTATVTIYGKPTVTSADVMAVTIPAASLVGGADLIVTSNESAKWDITAPVLSLSPATPSVVKGGARQFAATVTETNTPAQTVNWGVTGNNSTSTTINESGVLSVGSDETAATLTVKAILTADSTKYGTTTVIVAAATTAAKSVTNADNETATGSDTTPYVSIAGHGARVTYTLQVTNSTPSLQNIQTNSLVIIDELPRATGDTSVVNRTERGSEFSVLFDDTPDVTVEKVCGDIQMPVAKEEYTIQYGNSVGELNSAGDWSGSKNGGRIAWGTESNEKNALRIAFAPDFSLASEDTIIVQFSAVAGDDADPGETAWNSFGYSYKVLTGGNSSEKIYAEPSRVGISVPGAEITLAKTVTGDPSPSAALFKFLLKQGITPLADVKYTLSDSNTVYRTGADGSFSLNAAQTAILSVPAGSDYTVEESDLPVNFTLTGISAANSGDGTYEAPRFKFKTLVEGECVGAVCTNFYTAPPTYALTVNLNDGNGTTGGDYAKDDVVSINAGTKSGYRFAGWTSSNGGTFADASSASTTFIMPDNATTITADWTCNGGGNHTDYYTLTFDTNGGSGIFSIRSSEYTTVDLTKHAPTKDGYTFAGWYSDQELTARLTSVKLTRNMTVYAGWELIHTNPQTGVDMPFADVAETDWFYEDVAYVFKEGLMNGTSDTTFSPNCSTTRGMIVAILYRLENSPNVSDSNPFGDVKSGSYYENAITWAAANGIVNGYGNDKFGPEDNITREQMAAILMNYARFKGYDITAAADLGRFSDAGEISSYAEPGIAWTNAQGLINGKGGDVLDPQGEATRAQAAAILHRFCENIVK